MFRIAVRWLYAMYMQYVKGEVIAKDSEIFNENPLWRFLSRWWWVLALCIVLAVLGFNPNSNSYRTVVVSTAVPEVLPQPGTAFQSAGRCYVVDDAQRIYIAVDCLTFPEKMKRIVRQNSMESLLVVLLLIGIGYVSGRFHERRLHAATIIAVPEEEEQEQEGD